MGGKRCRGWRGTPPTRRPTRTRRSGGRRRSREARRDGARGRNRRGRRQPSRGSSDRRWREASRRAVPRGPPRRKRRGKVLRARGGRGCARGAGLPVGLLAPRRVGGESRPHARSLLRLVLVVIRLARLPSNRSRSRPARHRGATETRVSDGDARAQALPPRVRTRARGTGATPRREV